MENSWIYLINRGKQRFADQSGCLECRRKFDFVDPDDVILFPARDNTAEKLAYDCRDERIALDDDKIALDVPFDLVIVRHPHDIGLAAANSFKQFAERQIVGRSEQAVV